MKEGQHVGSLSRRFYGYRFAALMVSQQNDKAMVGWLCVRMAGGLCGKLSDVCWTEDFEKITRHVRG